MGLGLKICQTLAEANGGRICRLEDQAKGTCSCLSLPLAYRKHESGPVALYGDVIRLADSLRHRRLPDELLISPCNIPSCRRWSVFLFSPSAFGVRCR